MRAAAFCGTRAIYDDMVTAAKSFIAYSSVDVVHMVIEDEDMGCDLPPIIKCHDLSGQTFFRHDGPNMASGYTYMAMMRIALCHIFPELDTILSLDADIVCRQNVDAIWDMPLEGNYLSASHEWHRTNAEAIYCNFGVVLYNLAALRDGKADECIAELNANRYPWMEQDVGNYRCQGHIHDMPSTFNSNWWTDKNKDPCHIRHFAGMSRPDWVDRPEVAAWRMTPWDVVMALHEQQTNR